MSLLTVTAACLQNDLGRPLCATAASQKTATSKRNIHSSLKCHNMLRSTWAADAIRMTQQYITYFCTFLETGTCH